MEGVNEIANEIYLGFSTGNFFLAFTCSISNSIILINKFTDFSKSFKIINDVETECEKHQNKIG